MAEYRLGTVTSGNLAVNSAGGAAVSTAVIGTETYFVRLLAKGGTALSTSGVRIAVGNAIEAPVAHSTTSALLTVEFPETFKVTPGQRISAVGNDGGTYILNVVELTF